MEGVAWAIKNKRARREEQMLWSPSTKCSEEDSNSLLDSRESLNTRIAQYCTSFFKKAIVECYHTHKVFTRMIYS